MLKLFETGRLTAFVVDEGSAKAVLAYERENREWLSQFSHQRNDSYYTLKNLQYYCKKQAHQYAQQRKLPLVFCNTGDSAIIAQVSLSEITYGSSYSAKIGYSTAKRVARQGIGTEAVRSVIGYAFKELKLHRLEATIMTCNHPSLAFAASLGFEQEGISREYLLINGKWEDYYQLALLNRQHPLGRDF